MDTDASTLPTCYRHHDRETRLACSTCDRPVCVDCARTAAVGQKCPECAAPERGSRVITARDLQRVARRQTPVTYTLLGLAAGLFVVGFLFPPIGALFVRLLAQFNVLVDAGQWYRLVTAAFLHAGLYHVLFNLWALYLFGPALEREVGSAAFAGLYVASAIAGGAFFFFLGSPMVPAVGASGAIFGLFGAWLVASYRTRHTLTGRASLRQLLVLLGINLALPLVFPAIAWQAHVGGLVAGMLIAGLWAWEPLRANALVRSAVAAGVGVAALAPVVLVAG